MEKNEPTQSKYDAALAKYNTQLDDAEIAAQAARIIAEKVPANNTPEVKKFLFNCIDLTTLKSEDSDESVMKFTQKVNKFDEEFPDRSEERRVGKECGSHLCIPQFCRSRKRHAGSGRCKNSLCISRFPLLPDFH